MKEKSDIGSFAKEVLKKDEAAGRTVKYVGRDNVGENTKQLREACEEEMGIILEFTAPLHSRTEWSGGTNIHYSTQLRVCNDARCEFQSGSARAIVV